MTSRRSFLTWLAGAVAVPLAPVAAWASTTPRIKKVSVTVDALVEHAMRNLGTRSPEYRAAYRLHYRRAIEDAFKILDGLRGALS